SAPRLKTASWWSMSGVMALLLQSAGRRFRAGHKRAQIDREGRRILAQSRRLFSSTFSTGRLLAIVVLMGVGIVAAFGLAPGTVLETSPRQWVTRELPVPRFDEPRPEDGFWREQRILRGDTLGSVLARSGVTDPSAQRFLATDHRSRALYQLKPGKAVRVKIDDEGRLVSLRYLTQSGEVLAVDRLGESFIVQSGAPSPQVRLEMRSTEIHSSLYAAADAVDLPDAVTMQLAEVFSGDVDFYHDLRDGDTFTVLYEVRMI